MKRQIIGVLCLFAVLVTILVLLNLWIKSRKTPMERRVEQALSEPQYPWRGNAVMQEPAPPSEGIRKKVHGHRRIVLPENWTDNQQNKFLVEQDNQPKRANDNQNQR